MQTFAPIFTSTRLSIQTSSPIQLLLPIERSHGYFTRMPGFSTTPPASLAPKRRRTKHRIDEDGSRLERMIGSPMKNHNALISMPRPGEYQELSYKERSIEGMRLPRISSGHKKAEALG